MREREREKRNNITHNSQLFVCVCVSNKTNFYGYFDPVHGIWYDVIGIRKKKNQIFFFLNFYPEILFFHSIVCVFGARKPNLWLLFVWFEWKFEREQNKTAQNKREREKKKKYNYPSLNYVIITQYITSRKMWKKNSIKSFVIDVYFFFRLIYHLYSFAVFFRWKLR